MTNNGPIAEGWGCFLFLLGVAVVIVAIAFAGYLGRQ